MTSPRAPLVSPQTAFAVGVVVRRTPGVTRWQAYSWKAVAVLPGAAPAEWSVLRRDGEAVEYHAATLPLSLYRSDTEAYLEALNARHPSVYVVMRPLEGGDPPFSVDLITASPYEAQDYMDSGEELVEKVPMPGGLIALIRDFIEDHHVEQVFVKRKRDKTRVDLVEDGKGDARVRQASDVYRAPKSKRMQ